MQGLMALASGGLFGVGLGNGMPNVIPASHTDYIFSVIGEEFGILFAAVVIVFYLVFIVRGMLIALNAENIMMHYWFLDAHVCFLYKALLLLEESSN